MTNNEAIILLRNLENALDSYCELNEEGKTAFRMAIEALSCSENPNNSDCISRQAAIDEVNSWLEDRMTDRKNGKPLTDRIKDLPSAQPDLSEYSDKLWRNAYERGQRDAQPERKKGKWIFTGDCYKCNECGIVYGWWADSQTSNYCPNCGAKMLKEGEEHG